MQEMNSPEITRPAKALLAVQRELVPASKDAANPFTRSRYATLNSVMEACREALLTHGIWLTQLPDAPPGNPERSGLPLGCPARTLVEI